MRILLIAYYYPPPDSGGSERPRQMERLLPGHGCDISVLTRTYGKSEFSPPGMFRVRDVSRNQDRGAGYPLWLALRLAAEAANRLGSPRTIYSCWKDRVLRHAAEIVELARPKLLLATYPPVEDLEIGLRLGREFGLPLVADFRDGLAFEPVESKLMARFACIRRRYREIEEETVREAAGIVCFSPLLSGYFAERYGHPRILTLPNGFDERERQDPRQAPVPPPPGPLRLLHTGGIGSSQPEIDLRPFCLALERLAGHDAGLGGKMRLRFVGRLLKRERRRLEPFCRRGLVEIEGQRPRPQVLAEQRGADLLLFFTPDRLSVAPAKLYEYIAAGRPILGLTPPGSFAGRILEETGCGWSIHPSDSTAIGEFLQNLAQDHSRLVRFRPDAAKIGVYSRQRQMERLAAWLQETAPG